MEEDFTVICPVTGNPTHFSCLVCPVTGQVDPFKILVKSPNLFFQLMDFGVYCVIFHYYTETYTEIIK